MSEARGSVEPTPEGDLFIHDLRVPATQDLKDWIAFEEAQLALSPGRTWEDAARDAIRLGALMVVRARAAVALDFVKQQAAEVSAEVRRCFEGFREATQGLFVDPKDPEAMGPVGRQFKTRVAALMDPVQSAINEAIVKITLHVDPHQVAKDGKRVGLAAFKEVVDAAQKAVMDALRGLNPETSPQLKKWLADLDPDSKEGKAGKVLAEMKRLAEGVSSTSSRLLGSVDASSGSPIPGQLDAALKRYLDLDTNDPNAPLCQIRDALTAEIQRGFAALTAEQAKGGKMPDHGAQIPKDGFSHEDAVLAALKEFVGQQGHVEDLGRVPGSLEGRKLGDYAVVLDDGHTRICVEAKTGDRPKGDPAEYLKDCALNRRCQFTIFAAKDATTLETWFNNPTWVWRQDAGLIATTRENLVIALHAAKISLAAVQQSGEGVIDPAALKAEAQNLVSAMEALRSISKFAGTIMTSAKTNAGKIQREAKRMAEQVIQSINRMRGMVGLKPDESLTKDLPQVEEDAA